MPSIAEQWDSGDGQRADDRIGAQPRPSASATGTRSAARPGCPGRGARASESSQRA